MKYATLTFDAAPSARSVDANGFLHVASSHITKATVNPYYGREIPGSEKLGLDPERIYYGFRDPEELRKSLPTWEGLPLHIEHHIDSAVGRNVLPSELPACRCVYRRILPEFGD